MGFVPSSTMGFVPRSAYTRSYAAAWLKLKAKPLVYARSVAMSLQEAEQEGWIPFQTLNEISCSRTIFSKTERCGRADRCLKCAIPPMAHCKAFVPREEMLRRLRAPTTEMLSTLTTRRLTTITSRGWRFFYRAFLPVMADQTANYKEDLACVSLPPMTASQLKNRAERRLMGSIAIWVRRTNTYGIEQIVVKTSDDAEKHAMWQSARCPVQVRTLFPTNDEAEQAQLALAMKGLGYVAAFNRLTPLRMWSKVATTVIPTPDDTLHNDVAQYWWDATVSSDEERERHGTSWGRKTDEELQAEFIANRDTSYFDNIQIYLRATERIEG